jgi:hypothetical protein
VRIIHFFVICALIFAAAYVYRIKMESAVRTERVLRLRHDVREERNKIARLHAEWAKLQAPGRLQGLVERHLALIEIEATPNDSLKNLPQRPPSLVSPDEPDPIAAMIDMVEKDESTGSVSQGGRR